MDLVRAGMSAEMIKTIFQVSLSALVCGSTNESIHLSGVACLQVNFQMSIFD